MFRDESATQIYAFAAETFEINRLVAESDALAIGWTDTSGSYHAAINHLGTAADAVDPDSHQPFTLEPGEATVWRSD